MKKRASKVGALTSARHISALIDSAVDWSTSLNPGLHLASALVYANIAEFFAESLVFYLQLDIDLKLAGRNVLLAKGKLRRNTSLGSSINALEVFEFPRKHEVLKLLNNVKGNRDQLFHSLLLAPERGFIPKNLIKNIEKHTWELIREYKAVIRKIDSYNKLAKLTKK